MRVSAILTKRIGGQSLREIGEAEGVTPQAITAMVKRVLGGVVTELVEQARALELLRLDEIMNGGVWQRAKDGDIAANALSDEEYVKGRMGTGRCPPPWIKLLPSERLPTELGRRRGVLTFSSCFYSFTLRIKVQFRGKSGCESMRKIRCRICFKTT